jgi:hypothetical protein
LEFLLLNVFALQHLQNLAKQKNTWSGKHPLPPVSCVKLNIPFK